MNDGYTGFDSRHINTVYATTTDFDGGGTDDTLTFDVVYDYYTGSTFSAGTLTLGTAATPQSGGLNWGDNTFDSGDTLSLLVQNISYTSGEADGTTVAFAGFTGLRRVDVDSTTFDTYVGGALTGQSTVSSTGAGELDISALGSSAQLYFTSGGTGNGNTIRLRDLDMRFNTVPVPAV
ncbi:MAG: hypothetical protein H7A51_08315 [Akkermansiaceae bacterium]|nr:hypothetical protein [Akkermansiaceae bacterium]